MEFCTNNSDGCSLNGIVKKINSRTWATLQRVDWGWCQYVSRKAATTLAFLISSHSWTGDDLKKDWTAAQCFSFHIKVKFKVLKTRGRVEAQNPRCLKSSVKFLQCHVISSCWCQLIHCVIKSTVNKVTHLEIWSTLCFNFLKNFMERDGDFLFQQDLAPARSTKTTSKWFAGHSIAVPHWPASSSDLNPKVSVLLLSKWRWGPKNTDRMKAAIGAAWASCTPCCINAVIHGNRAPTTYKNILYVWFSQGISHDHQN